MKIQKNIEANGFRLNLILETNDRLSHKLLSENEILLEELAEELYATVLQRITDEKNRRNL